MPIIVVKESENVKSVIIQMVIISLIRTTLEVEAKISLEDCIAKN